MYVVYVCMWWFKLYAINITIGRLATLEEAYASKMKEEGAAAAAGDGKSAAKAAPGSNDEL